MADLKSNNWTVLANIKSFNGTLKASVKSKNSVLLPSAVTYATRNPADKWANVTLSGGNLTATWVTADWDSVRATIYNTTWKWYREVKLDNASSSWHFMVGVGNSSAPTNNYIGIDVNWRCFYDDFSAIPYKGHNWFTGYGSEFAAWDIVWVALDLVAGSIEFFKNNVSMGTAFTGITWSIAPMVSVHATGTITTANFGATAMAYSPPVWFNAWFYI